MELNRAVPRDGGEPLRSELQHIGHDAEIDIETAQGLQGLLTLERGQLEQPNSALLGRRPQRIGCGARLVGGAKNPGDGIAPLDEGVENGFTEFLLSDDGNAHK